MDGKLGKEYLKSYIQKKQPLLDRYINNKYEEAISIGRINEEILKRYLKMVKEGKGIRGALILLGYQIANGMELDKIMDASIFIELFHSAILIHDDIMDEDDLRRGLTTMHRQFEHLSQNTNHNSAHYGESMAIDVGDIGIFMSFDKLVNLDFPAERLLKCARIYSNYLIRLGYGQALDVTGESLKNIHEQDILNVYKYKTSEYTGVLPLLSGATLAGETNETKLKAMESYGNCFGWAFQIQDDTIGLYGTEEETGKPITSDLREGKNTLFMLHLAKYGTAEQKDFQKNVLGNKNITKEDVYKMQKILKEAGSYDHVINLGWKYVEEGKKYIPQITDDQNLRDILESLLVYMMERTQ